jgi:CRISPR-associated protein Cas4
MIPVSWLGKWLFCPMGLYLEAVLGIKPKQTKGMVRGVFVHRLLGRLHRADEGILKQVKKGMSQAGIQAIFRNEYLKIARNTIIQDSSRLLKVGLGLTDTFNEQLDLLNRKALFRSRLASSFADAFGVFGNRLAQKVRPGFECEVFVESRVFRLRGEVDLIEEYPAIKVPIEFKSSAPPGAGVWESDQLQLAAYIMILNQAEPVRKGYVEYLQTGERIAVALNPFIEKKVLEVKDEIARCIESRNPPHCKPHEARCAHCSVKQACRLV